MFSRLPLSFSSRHFDTRILEKAFRVVFFHGQNFSSCDLLENLEFEQLSRNSISYLDEQVIQRQFGSIELLCRRERNSRLASVQTPTPLLEHCLELLHFRARLKLYYLRKRWDQ